MRSYRPEEIREALVRQWLAIGNASASIDPDAPSRLAEWRNREVLAHRSLQPRLLARFLRSASTDSPQVTLAANLSGTGSRAEVIDAAARDSAKGAVHFEAACSSGLPALAGADLTATILTLQGSISVADYLVTRCVEGVVHGCDLVEPVEPDADALAIAAHALVAALAEREPRLVPAARAMDPGAWINAATGRTRPSRAFEAVLPLMS